MQHLSPQPTPFIGRMKELNDVVVRLTNPKCRLLTLIGGGGSGKTRLALEALRSCPHLFTDGAVFVGLQSISNSQLLVPAIAHALDFSFYQASDSQTQLLNYLQEKSLLLLLDNFEHMLDGTSLISQVLNAAPGIKLLVTSREALNLQEEWLYPVKGMEIPPSVYSAQLQDYEAVQLFVYHAQRIQPDFKLDNEHEAVIRICKISEGLPLAIELAASWLKGLSASRIAAEMQQNLDFLVTTSRNVEERHRSIRAVFDHSWALLAENERLIFSRLSVFHGRFSEDAALQVTEASYPVLAALVEKSLIRLDTSGTYGLHELLRQYGMEKLESYGQTNAIHERHSRYFAQLMLHYEAALKQPQQLEAMQEIEDNFENIRLAWEWSSKNQQTTHLHKMLNGLYLFGFLRSRYNEIIPVFQNSLEQIIDDSALLGRLLVRRWGYLHWWYEADYRQALLDIERAREIALTQDNKFEIALCHLMTAYAMISMQRYQEALPHLEISKSLFDAIREPYYVCWTLHRLGYVYSNLNETQKGIEYTEQSLAIARISNNRLALVICLYNLGSDYILNRNYTKGKHYCAEALQIATESGHRGQIAHALSLLALCAFCEGDFASCQNLAGRSYSITEEINLLVFQPYNISLLILLACLREDYEEGIRLSQLGKHYNTNTMGLQLFNWSLGVLACGLDNPAEARMYIEKVFQLSDTQLDASITIWLLPGATYTLAKTAPHKAVQLLSWVFAYPDTATNWIRQWSVFQRLQAQLQEVMNTETYQLHWKKGEALSLLSVESYLRDEFGRSSDIEGASHQQLLTPRELEILRYMATGLTNPQIAEHLIIGVGTVKTHTLNIYRKLDVTNRTQAIVRARELGLLPA